MFEVSLQGRVFAWVLDTFGLKIAQDVTERNHRFFEEATELVQATGMTRSEGHQLVDYVFDRPIGDRAQELGGVEVTLAALAQAINLNKEDCGETELQRCWTKADAIKAKQAAKPAHSPLPVTQGDPLTELRARLDTANKLCMKEMQRGDERTEIVIRMRGLLHQVVQQKGLHLDDNLLQLIRKEL